MINNKKGMTLLELIVYIALAAMLLAPVVMLMRNSSVNMARDATQTDMRMSGRDILNIIYDDLKNTGFKLNPANFEAFEQATFMGHPESTTANPFEFSFWSTDGDAYDRLEVLMGRLTPGGDWGGVVDTITYFVNENRNLVRRIGRRVGVGPQPTAPSAPPPLGMRERILARNVEALQFEYSLDLADGWHDDFVRGGGVPGDVEDMNHVRFIRVSIVLQDEKNLAGTVNQALPVANHTLPAGGQHVRTLHSIVVPIPNNGLFPP
jgi:hypothetical protein